MVVALHELPTREARLMEFFRHLVAIGAAAVVTGIVVGGIGSRLFMLVARLLAPERVGVVTENGNRVGEVTFGGTMGLVVFVGILTAMALGVTAAAAEPWLRWVGRLEGIAVGVLVLLLFSPVVLDPENFDFFVLGHQAINVAMIVALFVVGGVGTVWLRDRFLAIFPREEQLNAATAVYALLASLGAAALAVMFLLLGFGGGAGESLLVASLLAALSGCALAAWGAWVWGVPATRWITMPGYGVLIAIVAITLPRLVSDITSIVP